MTYEERKIELQSILASNNGHEKIVEIYREVAKIPKGMVIPTPQPLIQEILRWEFPAVD